jgi:hypothetical protein
VPVDGEGIDARSVTAERILPSRADGAPENLYRRICNASSGAQPFRMRSIA